MAHSNRIAAIDWMRGFVMILMIIDHVAMAYNINHFSGDSSLSQVPSSSIDTLEFYTRWMTHLCAPVFVFLAGTALAMSIERKQAKGVSAWQIDKDILLRGGFIALLDPTIISLFSGKLLFQVLYAIGVSMMCMALLRRLSSTWLIILVIAWLVVGEWLTGLYMPPVSESGESIVAALLFSSYSADGLVIKYPLLPWLSVMVLGWVFGRYLLGYLSAAPELQQRRWHPAVWSALLGLLALSAFTLIRYLNDYGNMFMLRDSGSLVSWLYVSKYPISASFIFLELGIMLTLLAMMMWCEKYFGVRDRGPLLVFGQTAMFFYLLHRMFLEGTATWLGWREFGGIEVSYLGAALGLMVLYPLCLWYRGFKQRHRDWILCKYI